MNITHNNVIHRMRLREDAKLRASKLGEIPAGKIIVVFDDIGNSAGAYMTVGLMPFALTSPWKNIMYCQVINPLTGTLAQFDAETRVQLLEGAHINWEYKSAPRVGDVLGAGGNKIALLHGHFGGDSGVTIDDEDPNA